MSKRIDIVYFYEYAARELDVACAVKYLTRKKYGLRAEILKWPEEGFHNIVRYRPKVVVLPFCYSVRNYYKPLTDWRCSTFFNLAWEQFFYRGNIKDKIPRDPFSVKHVIHHAWSSSYADFLSACGIPRENIFLNANPALALYTQPYRKYFENEARSEMGNRYGLDPAKRWIFFPENYRWAFCNESDVKIFADDELNEGDVRQMIQYCHKSLSETLGWCAYAARQSNIEIIIRPRHTVSLSDFRSFVGRILPSAPCNIHIIKEGTVREWIMTSDLVVSSYSTSLIEAAVAGKPVFMLEPIPMPETLYVKWHDLLPKLKTQSEFHKACDGTGGVEAGKRLRDWACDTMLSNGDCIMNIAVILDGLCRNNSRKPVIPRKDIVPVPENSRMPWWVLYVIVKMLYLSMKNKIEKNRSGRIFRKFLANQQEIDRKVERWGEVLSSIP